MIYLIKKTFKKESGEEILYYKFYIKVDSYFIEIKINDYLAKRIVINNAIKNKLVYDKISDID